jgi:hypothetical protein
MNFTQKDCLTADAKGCFWGDHTTSGRQTNGIQQVGKSEKIISLTLMGISSQLPSGTPNRLCNPILFKRVKQHPSKTCGYSHSSKFALLIHATSYTRRNNISVTRAARRDTSKHQLRPPSYFHGKPRQNWSYHMLSFAADSTQEISSSLVNNGIQLADHVLANGCVTVFRLPLMQSANSGKGNGPRKLRTTAKSSRRATVFHGHIIEHSACQQTDLLTAAAPDSRPLLSGIVLDCINICPLYKTEAN